MLRARTKIFHINAVFINDMPPLDHEFLFLEKRSPQTRAQA
jgi:hypothetical protein